MALAVFLAFVAVPIAEIAVFIQVGGLIGLWPTLLTVVATAIAGTWLMRMQGLGVLARAQAALERNELPVVELVDGICILVAGVLLLTPGFITDAAGLLLLVPPVRAALRGAVWRLIRQRGRVTVFSRGPGFTPGPGEPPTGGGRGRPGEDNVIEGEWRELPPERSDEPGDGRDQGRRR